MLMGSLLSVSSFYFNQLELIIGSNFAHPKTKNNEMKPLCSIFFSKVQSETQTFPELPESGAAP